MRMYVCFILCACAMMTKAVDVGNLTELKAALAGTETPIVVTNTIVIPAGETLTIETTKKLYFNVKQWFTLSGTLTITSGIFKRDTNLRSGLISLVEADTPTLTITGGAFDWFLIYKGDSPDAPYVRSRVDIRGGTFLDPDVTEYLKIPYVARHFKNEGYKSEIVSLDTFQPDDGFGYKEIKVTGRLDDYDLMKRVKSRAENKERLMYCRMKNITFLSTPGVDFKRGRIVLVVSGENTLSLGEIEYPQGLFSVASEATLYLMADPASPGPHRLTLISPKNGRTLCSPIPEKSTEPIAGGKVVFLSGEYVFKGGKGENVAILGDAKLASLEVRGGNIRCEGAGKISSFATPQVLPANPLLTGGMVSWESVAGATTTGVSRDGDVRVDCALLGILPSRATGAAVAAYDFGISGITRNVQGNILLTAEVRVTTGTPSDVLPGKLCVTVKKDGEATVKLSNLVPTYEKKGQSLFATVTITSSDYPSLSSIGTHIFSVSVEDRPTP
ncbi:MAG: hypothetical protein RR268_00385 [Kiritimatiellia bacterium]